MFSKREHRGEPGNPSWAMSDQKVNGHHHLVRDGHLPGRAWSLGPRPGCDHVPEGPACPDPNDGMSSFLTCPATTCADSSQIDFGLSVLALCLFIIRTCSHDEQKYTYALAAELMMTIVRIPPVCYTARETIQTPAVGVMPKFALGIFLLNLIFRFVDTIGYTLLYLGYDPRKMFLAGLSWKKQSLYTMCTFIVWCAFIPN